MPHIVLMRHGQSEWNHGNRFAGWQDVDLTPQGEEEAVTAGRLMRDRGLRFDLAFTSVLGRAIRTLHLALREMDDLWIPVAKDWRLNERHYGWLTGMNKIEAARAYGETQVRAWRRGYDAAIPPPGMELPFDPSGDPRYVGVDVPVSESLKDVRARVVPLWVSTIAPEVEAGKSVLLVAHGNTLRALIMHLSGISPDKISSVEIPTGEPMIYELGSTALPFALRALPPFLGQ